ncbi:MAG: nitroreductase family protein [Candidatus Wallbacteria bacterium]|nr:nitroreductase family protein [Candidatus Wallbacteria bacterium]
MDFEHVIRNRRSVRQFKHVPIPTDDIRLIVKTAALSANANNAQIFRFIAVINQAINRTVAEAIESKTALMIEDEAERDKFLEHVTFFKDAPCTIYVFKLPYHSATEELVARVDPDNLEECKSYADYQTIGAAVENLMLTTFSLGYSSCYMCAPLLAAPEVKKILAVDKTWKLAALVPIGLGAEFPSTPQRLPLDVLLKIVS